MAGHSRLFSPSPTFGRSPSVSCLSPLVPQSPRPAGDTAERMRNLRSLSASSLRNQTNALASMSMRDSRSRHRAPSINLSLPRSATHSLSNGYGKNNAFKKRGDVMARFNLASTSSTPDVGSPPPIPPVVNGVNGNANGNGNGFPRHLPPTKPKYIKETKSKAGITILYEPGSIRESRRPVNYSECALFRLC